MNNVIGEWNSRRIWIDGGYQLFPDMSQKIRNHSPDGFNWGYGGSGPAQLALALLLHFADDKFARQHHQDFKWDVIAKLPQTDFEILSSVVTNWIKNRQAT